MSDKLPSKPSALIRQAVRDLQSCERSSRYWIDMHQWHTPHGDHDDVCYVCLAGSVMAQSLGSDPSEVMDPVDLDVEDENKMLFLNSLRCGLLLDVVEFNDAFPDHRLSEDEWDDLSEHISMGSLACVYSHVQPEHFHEAMLKAAKIFEEEGL